ncbi:MAG: hypothetical protein Kow00121_62690 [Elainellaceae cyanobacterium]
MTNSATERPHNVIGKFLHRTQVETAYQALESAGFSAEQLDIEATTVEANQPISQTRARESATGGAIAGAVFGAAAGFLLSIVVKGLPEQTDVTLLVNPLLMTFAGGALGAFGIGVLGAASGVNVPKTESDSPEDPASERYLLRVNGTQEQISRAAEVLRQKGIEAVES